MIVKRAGMPGARTALYRRTFAARQVRQQRCGVPCRSDERQLTGVLATGSTQLRQYRVMAPGAGIEETWQ